MKRIVRSILRKVFYQRYYNWWDGIRKYLLNDSDVKLTKDEIQETNRFHRRFTNLKLGYTYYKTVKFINNYFDINYIQDTLYYSYILRHLNPYEVICLDEQNNPLLIEANLLEPGILYEQLCTGPIFGERTEEVLNYVTKDGPVNMWIKHFRKS